MRGDGDDEVGDVRRGVGWAIKSSRGPRGVGMNVRVIPVGRGAGAVVVRVGCDQRSLCLSFWMVVVIIDGYMEQG